jgi:phenylalanine-4-hydroxylase
MRANEHPADMKDDYTCLHRFEDYTEEDHAIWRELFNRQSKLLVGRACDEYLQSLPLLGVTAQGIPDFRRMSDILEKATGWTIVTVPGLIPGEVFHRHLAHRRFPVTWWIRSREQIDYLAEPDIFHDLFGHVPMLMNPVFADYMQEFGKGGVKADSLHAMDYLARLYWYTVEFGLIRTPDGIRIYGSGIVSSKTESIYCLEDARPHRIGFDLTRVMCTDYRYDKLQESYFVIDSFEQLFDATLPDFTPLYTSLGDVKNHTIEPYRVLPDDRLFHRGTVEGEAHEAPHL